jgi:hypothetical protein
MNHDRHEHAPMAGRAKIGWIVFAVIAAFYLLSEHRAHFLGALPFPAAARLPADAPVHARRSRRSRPRR